MWSRGTARGPLPERSSRWQRSTRPQAATPTLSRKNPSSSTPPQTPLALLNPCPGPASLRQASPKPAVLRPPTRTPGLVKAASRSNEWNKERAERREIPQGLPCHLLLRIIDDMRKYLYITLDPRGQSQSIEENGTGPANLPELLRDGWRPVRETPFAGQYSLMLILLEKDPPSSTDALTEPAQHPDIGSARAGS